MADVILKCAIFFLKKKKITEKSEYFDSRFSACISQELLIWYTY